jgi:hypothetical protein
VQIAEGESSRGQILRRNNTRLEYIAIQMDVDRAASDCILEAARKIAAYLYVSGRAAIDERSFIGIDITCADQDHVREL